MRSDLMGRIRWIILFLLGMLLYSIVHAQTPQNAMTPARHRATHASDPNLNALPIAGGTMTGTITGFSTVANGDVLVLPPCADDPNCRVASIRFDTKGPYDNGSWFITTGSADDGPADGQSNHPFAVHYNSRVLDDHGQRRILDGSHVINMAFESRFPPAGDPNVVRGLFEWNLDIDPRINVGDPASIQFRRPFALHYDMDVGKTTFAVGLGSDPNSGFFQFGTGFTLFANNDGFRFGDRADAGSDPQDPNAPGMITLDPGCIMPANWGPRIANCSGGLLLDPGRNTIGVVARAHFGRDDSGDSGASFVFGNSAFDPGWVIIDGGRDAVQLRVMGHSTQTNSVVLVEKSDGTDIFNMLNDGIYHAEFAEDANPPACAAGNYNLFTSNSTNIMRVCNNGVRGDIPSSLAGSGSLDFPTTAIDTCDDLTLTVTGAADGDVVSLGAPNASVATGSQFMAWVSGSNTVTVRHCCEGAANCDPGTGTFKARVDKP